MFQTRFKCFKHVANVQNTFIIFKTRFKCFKHVNIQNTFIFKAHFKCFQRRYKYAKHVAKVFKTWDSHEIKKDLADHIWKHPEHILCRQLPGLSGRSQSGIE